jgi:hypothetical protein
VAGRSCGHRPEQGEQRKSGAPPCPKCVYVILHFCLNLRLLPPSIAQEGLFVLPYSCIFPNTILLGLAMKITDENLVTHIDKRIKAYGGDLRVLTNAIGYLMIGRKFGWKPMLLMHDRKSIKKYEDILDFDSKESMPEVGPWADSSVAWKAVQKVSNFWKAVKGEIPNIRSTEISRSR